MSNTFIYEQGWLVEKPEMEKPDRKNYDYVSDYEFANSDQNKGQSRDLIKLANTHLDRLTEHCDRVLATNGEKSYKHE